MKCRHENCKFKCREAWEMSRHVRVDHGVKSVRTREVPQTETSSTAGSDYDVTFRSYQDHEASVRPEVVDAARKCVESLEGPPPFVPNFCPNCGHGLHRR